MDIIKQGESYNFEFDRGEKSITGWTCLIELKQFPGDSAILSRTITPTGSVWSGFLTQTETSGLSVGMHYLIAKLANTTTDEEEKIQKRINVSRSWV